MAFVFTDSLEPNQEIDHLIPGLDAIRMGDLPSGVVLGDLESPLAITLHKMGRSLVRATVVLINSFQELDPDLIINLSSNLNNFLNIGPFNLIFKEKTPSKYNDHSCIAWLDNQKTRAVAYISIGRVCKPEPHELIALAETLEETKTPFLWSIDADCNKHFPTGFLERTSTSGNGKVVPWVPQDQVLNHDAVGVFVTHGGWTSVLESLGAGVPMICRPFFGDHHINSRMVESWGIGLKIQDGNFTKHTTLCALDQVFSHQYERTEALKNLARKAVAPNGSSDQNFKILTDVITRLT